MIIYTHQLTQQYHQNYHKIASMKQNRDEYTKTHLLN